jgi:hypothetical protein
MKTRILRIMPILLAFASIASTARSDQPDASVAVDIRTKPVDIPAATVHATTSHSGQLKALFVTYLSRRIDIPVEAFKDIQNFDVTKPGSIRGTADLTRPEKPQIHFGIDAWDPALMATAKMPVIVSFGLGYSDILHRAVTDYEGPGLPHIDGPRDVKDFQVRLP